MSGSAPVVAFFCATYLKPEMLHIHRQIHAVAGWQPLVVTQKVENPEVFPIDRLEVVPRSPWRFVARAIEKHGTQTPWQITAGEARRIRRLLGEHDVRVLHVFFGNVAVHLLPLLESAGVPIVVSFHGADVTGAIASAAYREARERVFQLSARVACRSEALVDAVHALGCPREKLCVVRTALPDRQFIRREMPADGAIRVVQACRLVPKKGLSTSLEAFAKLASDHPGMTFTIAGAGPLEAALRDQAGRAGLAGRVTFTGFLDQVALGELFAEAHVFIHPSESVGGDTEGIPNGLLEAMACGLPVVATRHGGIPEAVEDGVSGLLCAERDASEVAAAIRRLVDDPALYARISRGGAEAVKQRFSREAIGESLRVLYDGVA